MRYAKYIKIYDDRYANGYQETVLRVNDDNIIINSPIWMKGDIITPILAKELSTLAEGKYQRLCPYRFIVKDGDTYIQFAQKKLGGDYKLEEKMVLRKSNSGNVKIAKEAFLYDVLDFLVYLNWLTEEYTLKGEMLVPYYETNEMIDEQYLKENGFIFPKLSLYA